MYAPQFYPPPQQLLPGYVQTVPIYQTPDQGQKRNTSPLFNLSGEKDEKRSRNEVASGSSIQGEVSENENYTILDIMNEFKKLATKDDLVQVKSTLVAQAAEIQQLKGEVVKNTDRIKNLEEQMSARAAIEIERTQQKSQPEIEKVNRMQYGGAHAGIDRFDTRRRSVIIHGLQVESEDVQLVKILDMFQEMGAIIFACDIEAVNRLGRSDTATTRPQPVRVTLDQNYMRDNVLRRKSKLATKEKFSSIFINADEPADVRRIKGVFRRIAYKARNQGKEVTFRNDWIQIDDITYRADELDKIPPEFKPDITRPKQLGSDGGAMAKQVQEKNENREQRMESEQACQVKTPALQTLQSEPAKKEYADPNVKLKITKCGLTFSGPTAFCSNMHRCDFVYNDQAYTSTEQGFQHLHAVHENEIEIANKILTLTNTKEIKDLSHNIPKSESWNRVAPGKLWSLNDAKYSQNEDLMEELIDTAPHRLVEASIDGKWGVEHRLAQSAMMKV